MLERASALAGTELIELPAVQLSEARDFSLLQVSRLTKAGQAVLGKLPALAGHASPHGQRTVMKVGSSRYWIVGPQDDGLERELHGMALLTPLSHSRTRILLQGQGARAVLARSASIDVSLPAFGPQAFAMTGIHHTPVLVHCIAEHAFHIYALRTFGLSVWDWLADAAQGMEA